MPNVGNRSTLPKPCKDLATRLGSNVSADALNGKDMASLRNKAFGAMRSHLEKYDAAKFEEFRQLENDLQRREWLSEFILDPASGGSLGKNYAKRELGNHEKDRVAWLTESQLAGPKYLNSADLAKIMIKSLPSMPHENESLRDAGVLVYKYVEKRQDRIKSTIEGAMVEQSASLTPEQYTEVKEAMTEAAFGSSSSAARGRSGNKRQRADPPPPETPEKKARRETIEKYRKNIMAMKNLHDKINRDMGEVDVIMARLKGKQWDTAGPRKYLKDEADKVTKQNKILFDRYVAQKDIPNEASSPGSTIAAEKMETSMVENDGITKTASDAYKNFKDTVLSEFNKI